jgi:hypothetical protein
MATTKKPQPRPALKLMICTVCNQRTNKCACAVSNAPGDNRDKRELAKRGANSWQTVRVWTAADVREAAEQVADHATADALLELLTGEQQESKGRRVRPQEQRPGRRPAMRGKRVG